jgi:hypothetical protein
LLPEGLLQRMQLLLVLRRVRQVLRVLLYGRTFWYREAADLERRI